MAGGPLERPVPAAAGDEQPHAGTATKEVAAPPSAARRLRPGPGGNPALDRLAALASRLLGARSSQVSLLTDVQTIAGGAGLPAGSVGSAGALVDSLCTVTASSGGPLVVHDARADSRVAGLPPVTSGEVGAYLGVPLTSDGGDAVGALCVFDPSPRHWSQADVTLLTELAASTVAELELAALSTEHESSRVAWRLAIEAAGVGTFDLNVTDGTLAWDDRLMDLFGYDEESFDGTRDAFDKRLHPDDADRVTEALQGAIDTCGEYSAEYRIVRPDGEVRWIEARGRALCDETGTAVQVLGAAYDTTAQRRADARVTRVLESMTNAFFLLDRQWRFSYVNRHAEQLLGRTREEMLGGNIWELFPLAVGSEFETHYRRAMESGQPVTFEAYYPPPLDAWYEVQAWPDPDGLSVYFLDISARRAAQEQTQRAARRAHLLAEVTSELTGTLDGEEAVARLAQLVVPTLADWCLVTLVDDDQNAGSRRGLRDVGWAHVDPRARPLVERYTRARWPAITDRAYVVRALRTGQIVQVRAGAAAAMAEVLVPGEARELVAQLAPESFTVLPLRGRGRTVGLLTLLNGADRGPISDADLETAQDVAGRAGLALDSGRLYRQQRDLAEALQRSLLTEPPEPDHAEVVVRYTAAAEVAQVGGDWYDAFLQPDGAAVLVIGDVIGHDSAAAAAMGQVRTMVRTAAALTGQGPADVLCGVDAVMETLQARVTATAVVARLEQTPDERSRGITHLRWSNAGHPPPMVINPDGTVAALTGVAADLLLGIDPNARRVESEVTLDRGATVLLFTDGLVERRGQSIDDGLAQLRDTLEQLAAEEPTLDELCDRVLASMLPPRSEDDVALVAVRLHRQDRPRPAEAGPRRIPDNVEDAPAVDPHAG
jgi:PAS domain S-box-containing protein